jgi:lipopolysaccharide export system permease protein
MKIIDRYTLRFLIGPFLFGTLLVVFLFLMQFLMQKLDDLVGKGLDNLLILKLITLNVPWMIVLAVPMGTLFGSLMAFGNMSSHHEVTIVKASGSGLLRMMAPIIIFGVVLMFSLFWFNNIILPESNHQAKSLLNDIKRKKPTFLMESGKFSSDLDGFTILSRKVDSLSGALNNVTIYDKTNSRGSNIISADSGFIKFNADYSKLIIELFDGEIHQLEYNTVKDYKLINFKKHTIYQNVSGFSLERTESDVFQRSNRELSIKDLNVVKEELLNSAGERSKQIEKYIENHLDYIFFKYNDSVSTTENFDEMPDRNSNVDIQNIINQRRLKSLPKEDSSKVEKIKMYNSLDNKLNHLINISKNEIERERHNILRAGEYEVEIQKKYSIPVACLLFVFVGCPLGILTRGGNFGVSAAISLGFYILYWIFLLGGEKLADRGFASPIISMWAGNFVIGLIGLFLTLRVSNESLDFLNLFKFKKK